MYLLDNFDTDDFIDICHTSQDNCSSNGSIMNQTLPPGWFALNNGETNVADSWGDGNCCNCNMGPWSVTFKLIAGSDISTLDNSYINIFSFSDSETGFWHSNTLCDDDEPLLYNAEIIDITNYSQIIENQTFSICPETDTELNLETLGTFSSIVYSSQDGSISGDGPIWELSIPNNSTNIETYIFNVQLENEYGALSEVTEVTVNVFPSIDIQLNDETYCLPGLYDLGGDPTATNYISSIIDYQWSVNNIDGISNPEIFIDETFDFSLTVIDDNNCINSASSTILISDIQDFEIIVTNTTCNDEETSFISTNQNEYLVEWTVNGISVASSFNFVLDQTSYNTNVFDITANIINDAGCISSNSKTIYLNTIPFYQFNINDSLTICSNDSLEIAPAQINGSNLSYFWSNQNFTSTDSSIFISDSGTYYLEITNDFGCSFVDSITIDFAGINELQIFHDTSSCNNSSSLLLTTNQSDQLVQWYVNNIPVDTSFEYLLVQENINNNVFEVFAFLEIEDCMYSDTSLIYLNTIPFFTFNHEDTISICSGDSIMIAPLNPNGINPNYQWISENLMSSDSSIQVSEAGTYYLEINNNFGCSYTDSIVIETFDVNDFKILADTQICNENISILLTSNLNNLVEWTINDEIIDTSIQYHLFQDIFQTNKFEIKAKIYGQACIANDSTTVYLNTIPTFQFNYPDTISICSGDSIFISPIQINGINLNYSWTNGAFSSTDSAIYAKEPGIYILNVSNDLGCFYMDSIIVEQNEDTFQILASDILSCELNDVITLYTSKPFESINWYIDGALFSVDDTIEFSAELLGNDTFLIEVFTPTANLCQESQVIEVYLGINEQTINSLPDSIYYCQSMVGDYFILQTTDSIQQITWTTPSNITMTDSLQILEKGIHHFTAETASGCTIEDSIYVTIYDEVMFQISGNDIVCGNIETKLQIQGNYNEILWNTSETTNEISVYTGNYSAVVLDSNNCTNFTDTIVINELSSSFDFTTTGLTVSFTNNSETAESYLWDFGDGMFSEDKNPIHVYESEGEYLVELISIAQACSDTTIQEVKIQIDAVQNENLNIKAYPNPAHQYFTIEGLEKYPIHDIKIINSLGQTQQLIEFNFAIQEKINVEINQVGLYFIKISLEDGTYKLIKLIIY